MVPIKEAAATLGITVNAVRQRLKRGTLHGVKTPSGWLVDPTTATTDQPPTMDATTPGDAAATTDQPPTDHGAGVDLSGLVAMIDDLRRENAQLHGAAAFLLAQNARLEAELRELRSIEATLATPDREHEPEPEPAPVRGWRKWLAWITGADA